MGLQHEKVQHRWLSPSNLKIAGPWNPSFGFRRGRARVQIGGTDLRWKRQQLTVAYTFRLLWAIMSKMPPPAVPRQLSRLRHQGNARAGAVDAVIDDAADLRGPLSTIPDGVAVNSQAASLEDHTQLQARQTDALSPVPWERYFESAEDVYIPSTNGTFRVYSAGRGGPVLFCIHGGGYTGLTWSLVGKHVRDSCRICALDMRGHGETQTPDPEDLSAETLTQDAVAVWHHLFADEAPPTVLIGHSVGGAVAVRAAASKAISNLQGLIVIDVVEGTALAALPHMQTVLKKRPSSFPSLASAVAWALQSGITKNREAAAVSLPSQLKREVAVTRERWVWRTPLEQSSPFWAGWYKGLSELFLAVSVPKVLMLAGTDRLDKTLTIGQMQGKFQMVVLPQAGHAVHEDEAKRTAEAIEAFVARFKIGQQVAGIH